MTKNALKFISFAAVAVVMASCALPPAPPAASNSSSPNSPMDNTNQSPVESATNLEGTLWNLISYVDPNGATQTALPDVSASMEFKGGRVGGKASCNTYFSSYTQTGTAISFSAAGSTMMACPDPLMAQERGFLGTFEKIKRFAVTGDQLQFSDAGGNVLLTLVRATPLSLAGHEWKLLFVNNGKAAAVSAVTGSNVTATFTDDGKLSGNGGCNGFGTTYMVNGDKIKIEPFMTTLKACADDAVTQQESWLFTALSKAATYRIRGKQLELRDDSGALQASFVTE